MRVHFYGKASGRSPVEEFISKLPKADQARLLEAILSIEEFGLSCPRVQFKPIRGKLWEIKIKAPGGGYRFFYVLVESDLMVILLAFKKKTQKAPQREIELAEKRMKEVI